MTSSSEAVIDCKRRQEFTFFSQLPAELQHGIWRQCLPFRVEELDVQLAEVVFQKSSLYAPCCLHMSSKLNKTPPAIARVCHQARKVAYEAGQYISDDVPPHPDDPLLYASNAMKGPVWEDPARRVLHLNWHNEYSYECGGDERGLPQTLRCLEWNVRATPANRASCGSFKADFLRSCIKSRLSLFLLNFFSFSDAEQHEVVELLGRHSKWMVVMSVVVIHAPVRSAATTSGLFGLLGDAPIQIVDIADTDTCNALYRLAQECEDSGDEKLSDAQDFTRVSNDELERELSGLVEMALHVERTSLNTRLHPAIMFRHCPLMCNHPSRRLKPGDIKARR